MLHRAPKHVEFEWETAKEGQRLGNTAEAIVTEYQRVQEELRQKAATDTREGTAWAKGVGYVSI